MSAKQILVKVVIGSVFVFAVLGGTTAADAPTKDPAYRPDAAIESIAGYELVWNDEFNADGAPDSSKWNFEHGFCRNNKLT